MHALALREPERADAAPHGMKTRLFFSRRDLSWSLKLASAGSVHTLIALFSPMVREIVCLFFCEVNIFLLYFNKQLH